MSVVRSSEPVTVLVAVRNEARNVDKCLASLRPARRVVVIDSGSTDGTAAVSVARGAEVIQFAWTGGYPKKRQWALESLAFDTPWILFADADEEVPDALWAEMRAQMADPGAAAGYLALKEFHFLGRRMRHGGFSHEAMILVRAGRARFERLSEPGLGGLDMEVHERVIVDGPVARLRTPLVHRDFKGLDAYRERHARYAEWEAGLRAQFLLTGRYGEDTVRARLAGNPQERRRALKRLAMRVPAEPLWWFLYHYVARLGFLEGWRGLLAARIRMDYIRAVRAGVRARLDAARGAAAAGGAP